MTGSRGQNDMETGRQGGYIGDRVTDGRRSTREKGNGHHF